MLKGDAEIADNRASPGIFTAEAAVESDNGDNTAKIMRVA